MSGNNSILTQKALKTDSIRKLGQQYTQAYTDQQVEQKKEKTKSKYQQPRQQKPNPRSPKTVVTPTNASKLAVEAVNRRKKLLIAIQSYLKKAVKNKPNSKCAERMQHFTE